MHDIDRVIDAFRNCITEPQCRDCPWRRLGISGIASGKRRRREDGG